MNESKNRLQQSITGKYVYPKYLISLESKLTDAKSKLTDAKLSSPTVLIPETTHRYD